MKTILADDLPFVPAGHENPLDPQVWKKVLFQQADLQAGVVQMVNWARLPPGKQFAAHYHEDMQEIFVIIRGTARLVVGNQTVTLHPGDAVRIDPREVHRMKNLGDGDVEYLAVGISSQQSGRTVVVDKW
jgi:mannose-6-phosphate isomerase-like protein (cupin superfamily)